MNASCSLGSEMSDQVLKDVLVGELHGGLEVALLEAVREDRRGRAALADTSPRYCVAVLRPLSWRLAGERAVHHGRLVDLRLERSGSWASLRMASSRS